MSPASAQTLFYTEAAREALEAFPVDCASMQLVCISENVTFRLTAHDGTVEYALRLHRPDYNTLDELESERRWLAALAETGLNVQQGIASRDGSDFIGVEIPGLNERRLVGVTTWVRGEVVGEDNYLSLDHTEKQALFHQLGELAARLHNHACEWQMPAGFVRRVLDRQGLLGEQPLWGRFWEHAQLSKAEQATLLRAKQRLCETLDAYGQHSGNFSLIHADLHPGNLVLDGRKVALIDFDDTAFGWHAYDLATALMPHCVESGQHEVDEALLQGYQRHRQLRHRDIEMIPIFVLIRAMATIGWLHQRPEHAATDYFHRLRNWVLEQCAERGFG